MNAPTIAGPQFVSGIEHMLTQTATIQWNDGTVTPPAGTINWQNLHADVACAAKTLVSGENRERRSSMYTLAVSGAEFIFDGWLSDVTTAMRVVWNSQNYDILAIDRVGDLDLTHIYAERRAT